MTESPTDLIRKPQLEVFGGATSGIVDHHASPITYPNPNLVTLSMKAA